jgi:hypothetical protein
VVKWESTAPVGLSRETTTGYTPGHVTTPGSQWRSNVDVPGAGAGVDVAVGSTATSRSKPPWGSAGSAEIGFGSVRSRTPDGGPVRVCSKPDRVSRWLKTVAAIRQEVGVPRAAASSRVKVWGAPVVTGWTHGDWFTRVSGGAPAFDDTGGEVPAAAVTPVAPAAGAVGPVGPAEAIGPAGAAEPTGAAEAAVAVTHRVSEAHVTVTSASTFDPVDRTPSVDTGPR